MNKIKILNFFTIFPFLFGLNVNSMGRKKPKIIKYEAIDNAGSTIEITANIDTGIFKCMKCNIEIKLINNIIRHLIPHKIKEYTAIYENGKKIKKQINYDYSHSKLISSENKLRKSSKVPPFKRKRKRNPKKDENPIKLLKTNNDDSLDSTTPKGTRNDDGDEEQDSRYNTSLITPSSSNGLSSSSTKAKSSFKREYNYVEVQQPEIMTLQAIDNEEYQRNNMKNPNYKKVVSMVRQKLPSGEFTPFQCDLCKPVGDFKKGSCKNKQYAKEHLFIVHQANSDEIKEIPFPDDTNNQTTVCAPLFTSTSSSLSSLASSSSFTSSSSSSSDTSSLRNLSLLLTTRNLQNQNIPISTTAPVPLSSSLSIDTVDAVNYIDDEPKDYIVDNVPLTSPSATPSSSSIEDKDGKEEREIVDAISDNVIIQNKTPFNVKFISKKNKSFPVAPFMNTILKRDNFIFILTNEENVQLSSQLNITLDKNQNTILLKLSENSEFTYELLD